MSVLSSRFKFMVWDPVSESLIQPSRAKFYFCTGLDCKAKKYVIWQDGWVKQ